MEVIPRRFAGICLGAFVLMALARPPRPTGQFFESYGDRSRLSATKQAMRVTDDSIFALERSIRARVVRNSAERALSGLPTGDRVQLLADPRIPASLQQHLRQVYADTRAAMPPSAVALPMLVVLDSGSSYSAQASAQWIEPTSLGIAACATIIRISVDGRAFTQLARRVNRVLGPNFPRAADFGLCGFEAAFGEPSPAMHRWMAARGWSVVRVGYDPAARAAKSRPMNYGLAFRYFDRVPWYAYRADDNGARALGFHACRAGKTSFCVVATAPSDEARVDRDGALPGSLLWKSEWWWSSWLGTPALMNNVAASIGPQRFAEAWRANDSLPESYRRLTGVPMDTLAHRALTETHPPLRAGASVTFAELVTVLLIAAAFAGLSTLTHPRRHKR
jgi:hypothetical protein